MNTITSPARSDRSRRPCIFAPHPDTAQQPAGRCSDRRSRCCRHEVSAWNRNRQSVVLCIAVFGMIVLATLVRAAALTICKPADPEANGHLQWSRRRSTVVACRPSSARHRLPASNDQTVSR
jgi:hypothetical protein